MSSSQVRRQPGRPAADDSPDAREALLDAASRLFAAHGLEGVSIRRLAEEAGVTPAMVHYYFGNKKGLYEALLTRTLARVLQQVTASAGQGTGLEKILETLFATVTSEPWIPALVVREVLSEGGEFREQFVKGYASHMAKLVPATIQRQVDAGLFRKDLDPTLAFMSLLGMSLMPFVARPVIGAVLGIEYDAHFVRRFAEHTQRLFVEGAAS